MRKLTPRVILITLIMTFSACTSTPTSTPQVVIITQVVNVTREKETPITEYVIVTAKPNPTNKPELLVPTQTLEHDWVDYGGICMRPNNIPDGIQINPDKKVIETVRTEILEGFWRLFEISESTTLISPSFSNSSRFIQGTLLDTFFRGPIMPVGKDLPRSDEWSFYLEDPVSFWEEIHPGKKFKGVSLDLICLEFFSPIEFEEQKQVNSYTHYIHLAGGVTHAIFSLEEIFGTPRMVIKLYKSPVGGTFDYKELIGFPSSNTPNENALAANEHINAIAATFNYIQFGNVDGDGYNEFGYNKYNYEPLPISSFHVLNLFIPNP